MLRILLILSVTGYTTVLLSCRADVTVTPLSLPADGTSYGSISVKSTNPFFGVTIKGPSGNLESIRVIENGKAGDIQSIRFRSTRVPGRVCFTIDDEPYNVTVYDPWLDSDNDGFPDQVEMDSETDRVAFREWFVRIAQAQYLKRNMSWQDSQRDCGGLIRYACREALKVHDHSWFARSGITADKNLPDVSKYNYPSVPLLGEKLFRVDKRYEAKVKSFSGFCDAKTLLAYNLHRIGTDFSDAKLGDILIFLIRHDCKEQYHSMIVIETVPEVMVVYHTGVDDVMKRVPLSYLDDAGPFRPVSWNRRFLGIYRFNILE